jgi:hypothetical protein
MEEVKRGTEEDKLQGLMSGDRDLWVAGYLLWYWSEGEKGCSKDLFKILAPGHSIIFQTETN